MTTENKKSNGKIKVKGLGRIRPLSLRKYVWGRFLETTNQGQELDKMVDQETLTKEIGAKYPKSAWNAKPKIHYSYYKSKFMGSLEYTEMPVTESVQEMPVTESVQEMPVTESVQQ